MHLLQQLLDPEQVKDIHLLAKQREWTSLLALIRKFHEQAKEELAAFITTDQAIERRGKVSAIKSILDAIQSTYNEVHKDNARRDSSTPDNRDDISPTDNAY